VDNSQHLKPPEPTPGDAAHTLVKVALSAIPTLGGPAAELFACLVASPLQRRRNRWEQEVTEAIDNLRIEGRISIDALAQDDVFLDTVLQASLAALRTHDAEKRAALRNAILNAALPDPPHESLQQMLISLVDRLTSWHLRILEFARGPRDWFRASTKSVPTQEFDSMATILHLAFPDAASTPGLLDQAWHDLHQHGLVEGSVHVAWVHPNELDKRTTAFGDQLLQFIREPPNPHQGDA
jgi:hypothetical protein